MSNVRYARLRRAQMGILVPAARQRRAYRSLVVLCSIISLSFGLKAQTDSPNQSWIHDRYIRGDFILVRGVDTADVLVSANDFKVVKIAAREFAADVERVTGKTPRLVSDPSQAARYSVIIGTLGKSALIDSLVQAGKLDLEQLRGKWESSWSIWIISSRPMERFRLRMMFRATRCN